MILIIDNYDSFTYNLVQYIGTHGVRVQVLRNDQVTLEDIHRMQPNGILVSPGPGRPEDAGRSVEIIRQFTGQVPILGVCLGHQCIGQVFDAEIVPADRLLHGKTSRIHHDGRSVYSDLPSPFRATRYHSLMLDPETVSAPLRITARTERGEPMGIRHTDLSLEGVQFHPESILTEHGPRIMKNFLDQCRSRMPHSDRSVTTG